MKIYSHFLCVIKKQNKPSISVHSHCSLLLFLWCSDCFCLGHKTQLGLCASPLFETYVHSDFSTSDPFLDTSSIYNSGQELMKWITWGWPTGSSLHGISLVLAQKSCHPIPYPIPYTCFSNSIRSKIIVMTYFFRKTLKKLNASSSLETISIPFFLIIL